MTKHELNARNLLCPIPVIRTQDKVKTLQAGDELTVYCTDPGALEDIPAWCRINGHKILATAEKERDIIISLRIG